MTPSTSSFTNFSDLGTLSPINDAPEFTIVGKGPVGLYLGIKLAEKYNNHVKIHLYENRGDKWSTRKNVVRIGFRHATELFPEEVRQQLLRDPSNFVGGDEIAQKYPWTPLNYSTLPANSIANIQNALFNHLDTILGGNLIKYDQEFSQEHARKNKTRAVFFAAGKRGRADFHKERMFTRMESDMAYVIPFENNQEKQEVLLNGVRATLGGTHADGCTIGYASASPYGENHTLLYLYDNKADPGKNLISNALKDIPKKVYDDAVTRFKQSPGNEKENPSLKDLIHDESYGNEFEALAEAIATTLEKYSPGCYEFALASPMLNVPREDHWWTNAADYTSFNAPILFIGDAAGATEYRVGSSMSRGLTAADVIVKMMGDDDRSMKEVSQEYSKYWLQVLLDEFPQFQPNKEERDAIMNLKYFSHRPEECRAHENRRVFHQQEYL